MEFTVIKIIHTPSGESGYFTGKYRRSGDKWRPDTVKPAIAARIYQGGEAWHEMNILRRRLDESEWSFSRCNLSDVVDLSEMRSRNMSCPLCKHDVK